METLTTDWITKGAIDFEYKQYILLNYLQKVRAEFKKKKLYPYLFQLIHHYQQLLAFTESRRHWKDRLPKKLISIDFQNKKLTYRSTAPNHEYMAEIERIVQNAIPKIQETIEIGKQIYEGVEKNITFVSVGLSAIYKKEGYLLLEREGQRNVKVFGYRLSHLCLKGTQQGTYIRPLADKRKSVSNTLEKMKMSLARDAKHLDHPATFAVISQEHYPIRSTLLPISIRLLMQRIRG